MTIYLTELLAQIERRQDNISPRSFAETLVNLGLIDHTLCKVLAVRQEVSDLMEQGDRKVDAMWKASEKFCCSYEYVRKCMYYYTDINMPRSAGVETGDNTTDLISR